MNARACRPARRLTTLVVGGPAVYLALNLARTRVHGRPFWSFAGRIEHVLGVWETHCGIVVTYAPVNSKTPLSLVDHSGQGQRVMGLGPTTFTLATCKPTEAKLNDDNELRDSCAGTCSAFAARSTESRPDDTDLMAVAFAWRSLPAAVRVGIVAMVRAAGKES